MTAPDVDARVEELVEDWPALSDEQLDRIAGMLRSGGAS